MFSKFAHKRTSFSNDGRSCNVISAKVEYAKSNSFNVLLPLSFICLNEQFPAITVSIDGK